MNTLKLLQKAEANEGMTVNEIKKYQKLVKPQKEVYGKYGNLAKAYIEECKTGMYWGLLASGDYPKYLHNIDKQAEDLSQIMRANMLKLPQYRKSEDFMKNLQVEQEIKQIIEENILNELVYV